MVSLRSGRQDRTLVIMVWVLTVVVLGLGIATVNPILLLWGVLGLPAAIFLTRIHLRDTRSASGPAGSSAAGDQPDEAIGPVEPTEPAVGVEPADRPDQRDRSDRLDRPDQ